MACHRARNRGRGFLLTTDTVQSLLDELEPEFSGSMRRDYPLARCGTYRIGGPAGAVITPDTPHQVARIVSAAQERSVPWMAVGLGSNLLFDDGGVDGVVIRVAKNLAGMEWSGSDWTVGAGTPTPTLARKSAAAGAAGVHRLIGVPGAVGGGVFMNAGAHGQEFRDVVKWVDLVDTTGDLQRLAGGDIAWAYRFSGLSGVIVAAGLELPDEDPEILAKELRRYLKHRRDGTPFDQPCCGSVFRNPSADEAAGVPLEGPVTAGRLIDAAGLKGYRVGAAEVSSMHANYIINTGNASAEDVRTVIADVRDAVQERFGVTLEREVKFVTTHAEIR